MSPVFCFIFSFDGGLLAALARVNFFRGRFLLKNKSCFFHLPDPFIINRSAEQGERIIVRKTKKPGQTAVLLYGQAVLLFGFVRGHP